MPRSHYPSDADQPGRVTIIERGPVLHDADPRDLQAAADELRDRTMHLEPDELLPAKKLVFGLIATAALAAVGTVVFRGELRALLGLG